MEIKINTLIPCSGRLKWVEVFGYTSKGTPGLEVTGLNGKSRNFKEKIVFLSKRRNLKFPILRYVLCLNIEDPSKSDIEWLELPLLLAFWSMTGNLPLKRLDNCFSSGKVSLEGEINYLNLDHDFWMTLNNQLKVKDKSMIFIGPDLDQQIEKVRSINAQSLLNENIGGFS